MVDDTCSVAQSDEARRHQVFKREFGLWSAFSFALSISGLYGTVMTTYSYPLYAGGAASAVWCWLIAGIGAMCLALSISEVASAYPTSGMLVPLAVKGIRERTI